VQQGIYRYCSGRYGIPPHNVTRGQSEKEKAAEKSGNVGRDHYGVSSKGLYTVTLGGLDVLGRYVAEAVDFLDVRRDWEQGEYDYEHDPQVVSGGNHYSHNGGNYYSGSTSLEGGQENPEDHVNASGISDEFDTHLQGWEEL
jgi:hypothetical protein